MIASAGTNPSNGIDYPFIYLHNEMVKYFQQRDRETGELRRELMRKLETESNCAKMAELLTGQEGGTATNGRTCSQKNAETRLESIGYRTGYVLVERFSKDVARFSNELDKVKFICKEFWTNTFGKGVDKLSTNHQGIYIIQDNRFYTVAPFAEGTQYLNESIPYLAFPTGIVRGALECLGIVATVTVQIEKLPVVKFNVQLTKS